MSPTGVHASEGKRLAAIELARIFRFVVHFRAVAAPAMAALGFFLLRYTDAWRGVACIAVGAPVFILSLWELRAEPERWLSPRAIFWFLQSACLIHFTLVVIGGGITSPWVIMLPMLGLVQGIVIGRRRLALAAAGIVCAFSCSVTALSLSMPGFEPAAFARGPAPPLLVLLMALLLLVVPVVAATVGINLREALERAVGMAAESRSQLVNHMQERNDELLALAGALAHELKNPLAAIRGLAALQAKKLEPSSKQAEQMGVLLDEVARMGSILDELSNFSRPARGLAIEPINPARVVQEIVHIHEPLATERGVRLATRVEDVPSMACDPRKLKQILVNLLQNAIDASEPGCEVTTCVRSEDGWRSFRIEDRGSGLADAVRGRLFTPGATTKLAGSGLGLTIARAIAEQHGGTLTLSEREGGGCTAEVRLPSRPPVADDERAS